MAQTKDYLVTIPKPHTI